MFDYWVELERTLVSYAAHDEDDLCGTCLAEPLVEPICLQHCIGFFLSSANLGAVMVRPLVV
jgi:hypothetical protein